MEHKKGKYSLRNKKGNKSCILDAVRSKGKAKKWEESGKTTAMRLRALDAVCHVSDASTFVRCFLSLWPIVSRAKGRRADNDRLSDSVKTLGRLALEYNWFLSIYLSLSFPLALSFSFSLFLSLYMGTSKQPTHGVRSRKPEQKSLGSAKRRSSLYHVKNRPQCQIGEYRRVLMCCFRDSELPCLFCAHGEVTWQSMQCADA